MWKKENDKLVATFVFKDFCQAFAFMTEVAFEAEKRNHHPDWRNAWNKVEIALSTHDAGDVVTEKDEALARAIADIYKRYQP